MTSLLGTPASATAAAASPRIIGQALYLELINNPDAPTGVLGFWAKDATKQVILFPEHLDEVGHVQPAQIWSRVVSAHSPRSQWERTILSRLVKKPTAEELAEEGYHISYNTYTSAEVALLTDREKFDATMFSLDQRMKSELLGTFHEDRIDPTTSETTRVMGVAQAWVLRNSKPIAIEITDEDMSLVRAYTTPQAAIRRINKVRVACGFPTKLV